MPWSCRTSHLVPSEPFPPLLLIAQHRCRSAVSPTAALARHVIWRTKRTCELRETPRNIHAQKPVRGMQGQPRTIHLVHKEHTNNSVNCQVTTKKARLQVIMPDLHELNPVRENLFSSRKRAVFFTPSPPPPFSARFGSFPSQIKKQTDLFLALHPRTLVDFQVKTV